MVIVDGIINLLNIFWIIWNVISIVIFKEKIYNVDVIVNLLRVNKYNFL